ncbi:MAG TPA: hypothetical protein VHH36_05230 [Candidatus Thermoplasmatota archaeon]|nr:hypothetical protein [Candidatus Thermoplasmatota archaeon]
MDPPPDRHVELTGALFDELGESAQEFLLQMLLYKSVFIGHTFRTLVKRETSPELRERLLRISDESVAEATAVAALVHEWDMHPGVWEHVSVTTRETRAQLLHDLIRLKEGMTEAGLCAAMRAPTGPLRDRFLKLVDLDRRHADELREFLGKTTTAAFREAQEHGLGAHDARDRRASLSGAIRARLAQFAAKGAEGRRLIVSGDGLRHLRDENAITEDGRCLGLPIDIDLGWEGDVYAIQTDERLTYAELVVAMRASDDADKDA